jgi:HSP20 family protein
VYTLARAPRVDPFAELDRLFDGVLAPRPTAAFDPALDVVEDEEAFVVRAEIPGVHPDDVEITLEEGTLTLRGEKKAEDAPKSGRVHRTERLHGAFTRTLRFGTGIDAEGVVATHRDGVLTVRLPKEAKSRARTIQVRRAD